MKFEIDFNRFDEKATPEFFTHIGATLEGEITLNTFEEMEALYKKINLYLTNGENDFEYSFVVSFDAPCIFIDKDV